ncbi:MAG TPA: peptidylprolyl isomerase [Polyangiales bacterium]|nr:peptidylprolyl isomerase [Polyangiales bacterium]
MPLQSFVREPLVHFALLGGLAFAADHAIRATRPDPRVIVVGPEVDSEARSIFRSSKGREPTPDELRILRERWIDNEVLYREGLALRLEQGDPALRERVIFKALNVIESNLRLPNIDDAALRPWFEQHRDQYDTPARYDFSEALPENAQPETIRQFAQALNSGEQLDVQSGLRIFQARPRSTIVDAFGEEFAGALDDAPLRAWHVLPSKEGARVVRLEERKAATVISFEEARPRVVQDFRDQKAQELRTAAVRELGKKYTLQFAGGPS